MIIHNSFTDGYFDYAKLFLESFKIYHGEDIKIVMTTTDLSDNNIFELQKLYNNLDIYNESFDYKPICEELNMSKEDIKKLKYGVEHHNARQNKYLRVRWKLHVAAERRVKYTIPYILNTYESEDLIIHSDIDMYIRKPLYTLFEYLRKYDFSVTYREYMSKEWRKIWMCLMGIKPNGAGKRFFKQWAKELDKYSLRDKPFAYGQISCYRVYKRLLTNKNYNLGNIPEKYIDDKLSQKTYICSGNDPNLTKDGALKLFKLDLERIKNDRK